MEYLAISELEVYFSAHNRALVHEQPPSWDCGGLAVCGMTGDAGVRLNKRER